MSKQGSCARVAGAASTTESTGGFSLRNANVSLSSSAFVRHRIRGKARVHLKLQMQVQARDAARGLLGRRCLRLKALEGTPGDFESSGNGEGETSGDSPSTNGNGTNASPGDDLASILDGMTGFPQSFSIIESSETMKDFGRMGEKDLEENITARRNTIFLLMEEVRRLRIQLKAKDVEEKENTNPEERYSSAIPFLPPLGMDNLKQYYLFYACTVSILILFGGLLAPALELKLGLGGLSYLEFIESMGLPRQLALVDPIVASFVGGAVGVLSSLLVVEVNNVTEREKEKCFYCEGSGYLACGECGGTGKVEGGIPCPNCSSTGKVMCTTCLCTGRLMATEHDPRIDPFV